MSGGDKNDPFPFDMKEANNIIQFPTVAQRMRRHPNINSRDWDIPYLAGYSVDGEWIFIDRDLALWHYLGKDILTNRFLILHEHVEKSIIDAVEKTGDDKDRQRLLMLLKMTNPADKLYYHAHGVATACELYAVQLQHGKSGVKSYNSFMGTQIKRAEDERIRRVPSTLDLTPYMGDDRQDVHLRASMYAAMVKFAA